jgi:hypothetical protein
LSEDLAMQRQGMAVQVQQQSMQPRMSKDAGAGGVTTGKAPSKRVPMAMQEIASVMQQMQQPAPTGAPAQGVQGPNSAM